MKGKIQKDGSVLGTDGELYQLPIRGEKEGYPEVLIDARKVDGDGPFKRQSIKPYIGKTVDFVPQGAGFNYVIIHEHEKE